MNFNRIRQACRQELQDRQAREVAEMQEYSKVAECWAYARLMTEKQRTKTEQEQKAIVAAKMAKQFAKEWVKIDGQISKIENAPDLLGVSLSIDWTPSRTWGKNPQATATIHTRRGVERYQSGRIRGCGYDKESTAASDALNQSDSLLKELYLVVELALRDGEPLKLREMLGYGSGYGVRPYFEGGVGVSCFYRIFEKIGYDFKQVSSGTSYNAYSATAKGWTH